LNFFAIFKRDDNSGFNCFPDFHLLSTIGGEIFKATVIVANFQDAAVICESTKQCDRRLSIAKHTGPLRETPIGGDDVGHIWTKIDSPL
jgi:hypothetical protein